MPKTLREIRKRVTDRAAEQAKIIDDLEKMFPTGSEAERARTAELAKPDKEEPHER